MVGVFVAFIRVVYERMIYMSLPLRSYTIGIREDDLHVSVLKRVSPDLV